MSEWMNAQMNEWRQWSWSCCSHSTSPSESSQVNTILSCRLKGTWEASYHWNGYWKRISIEFMLMICDSWLWKRVIPTLEIIIKRQKLNAELYLWCFSRGFWWQATEGTSFNLKHALNLLEGCQQRISGKAVPDNGPKSREAGPKNQSLSLAKEESG